MVKQETDVKDSRREVLLAYFPYLVIVAVFSLANVPQVKELLGTTTQLIKWPGIDVVNPSGHALAISTYKFDWLANIGTLLLLIGVITALALKVPFKQAVRAYWQTLVQLRTAVVTVLAVLALAYVMNASGQTVTLGLLLAQAGPIFALMSPVVGWLGTAVTGSDTSSNSLFGALQVSAANAAGLNPLLTAAGNTSGGVLGKMISPQNLAVGAAAVGLAGREGDLFRKVVGWTLAFLVFMCALVYLQSTAVLAWMLP
jgi:lactate permease